MALSENELKALHNSAGDAIAVLPYSAEVVAALYAALLNVTIPVNVKGVTRFTAKQAFELTSTLMYETLRETKIC